MKAFKLIFTELILFMIKEYSFENALFIYNKLLEMGESNIEYLCSLNKSDINFFILWVGFPQYQLSWSSFLCLKRKL